MMQTESPCRGNTRVVAPIIGQKPLSSRTFSGRRRTRASSRSASMACRIRLSRSSFSIFCRPGRKTIFIRCGNGLARADEAGIEGHAAVDVNWGVLNVIRFVGGEPHGDARDILGFPNSL